MKRPVDDLLLLCRCLSLDASAPAIAGLREALSNDAGRWPALIELANRHFVTPALWAALVDKGLTTCLPTDARDFLEEAYRLNGIRNARIRKQAVELIQALNGAGITPVLLKGGVYLFEGDRRAVHTRMMVDLDLLVPKDSFETGVSVTRGLGYRVIAEHQDWTHDYHPLGRPGDSASVELHRDVGEQRSLLPVNAAFRRAVPLEAGKDEGQDDGALALRALSPTDRVLHSIFHAQIQDRHYGLGRVPLRHLHDLTLINDRHGREISWQEVRAAMRRERYGTMLDCYLDLANRLLGFPPPPGFARTWRTGLHYRRCLAQIRHGWLRVPVDLWGTLIHPFGRWRIDYIYGPARNPLVLNFNRLRRALALARKYNYRPLAKIKEIHGRGRST